MYVTKEHFYEKKKCLFKKTVIWYFYEYFVFVFQDVSDSLPPLPSRVNEDLPPLPPPPSEIPAHNRDLPPPPPPTNPAMPQDLPPRGKDGYTQASIIPSHCVPQSCIF